MSEFGARLKQAREERGISLRQIATTTKISIVALGALERDDFSRLPGGIFSRAFVRAYALEVGLDPDATVEEFLIEYEQNHSAAAVKAVPEVTADDRAFLERQRRAARWLRAISIGFVLLIVGLAISWRVSTARKSANATASASGSATAAAGGADRLADDPASHPPAPAATPATLPTDTALADPAAAPPANADQVALRLRVTAECWVRATVDGTVVLEQVLAAGESRDLAPGRDVYLQVGNAGAVQWSINGRPAKELGKSGQTVGARITRATLDRYLQQ
jgi:cytoskeletal protein RodZ